MERLKRWLTSATFLIATSNDSPRGSVSDKDAADETCRRIAAKTNSKIVRVKTWIN